PMIEPYSGTKWVSTSGRFAITRKKPLGFLLFDSRPARNSFSAGGTRLIAIGISIEALNEFAVAFHEVVLAELVLRLPAQVAKDPVDGLAAVAFDPQKEQPDRIFSGVGEFVARNLP